MDQHIGVRATEVSVDRRIARLAARRHGVFSRKETLAAGATRGIIDRRLATGRWEQLHVAVYRLAGSPSTWLQGFLAACLTAGDGALVSHRSAGALWPLPGGDEGVVEISVPSERRVRRPGVIVHRAAGLIDADRAVVSAIPVTSPTRTLIDIAAVVEREVLEEALDEALRRNLSSIPRLRWRLNRLGRGRPGARALWSLVEARTNVEAIPQSVFETKVLRVLRRGGLPRPVCQFPIWKDGRVVAAVDFAYVETRVAIEADGYQWHTGRQRWSRDLKRRNVLTALGWRVIHVTWGDMRDRPEMVVQIVGDALNDPRPER